MLFQDISHVQQIHSDDITTPNASHTAPLRMCQSSGPTDHGMIFRFVFINNNIDLHIMVPRLPVADFMSRVF